MPKLAILGDSVRAALELAFARLSLDSPATRKKISDSAIKTEVGILDPRQAAFADRVSYVIPRIAARLPWRADCLVQALAAEHWLARSGIDTTLHVGVRKGDAETIDAHAWLTAGDLIVTGGEITDFRRMSRA